jgi:hypothetical protein
MARLRPDLKKLPLQPEIGGVKAAMRLAYRLGDSQIRSSLELEGSGVVAAVLGSPRNEGCLFEYAKKPNPFR